MDIPPNLNLENLEALYQKISQAPNSQVRLPKSLFHGGPFGVDAALIQVLVTWVRTKKKSTLQLYSESEDLVASLSSLSKRPAGLAALCLAQQIVDSKQSRVPRSLALAPASDIVDAMYRGDIKKIGTGGVMLFCIAGAEREYLRPFYLRDERKSIRPRRDFDRLAKEMLDVWVGPSKRAALPIGHEGVLGGLIYELIRNTDEHATTDVHGNEYRRSVRGLLLKVRRIEKEDVSAFSSGHPQFTVFLLRSLVGEEKRKKPLRLLELSIFDSGPGLARRWLTQEGQRPLNDLTEISYDQEEKAVRTCFEKYMSTKTSQSAGVGLTLVTDLLQQTNGFLRIRTGRVCLFQDFSSAQRGSTFAPRRWHTKEALAPAEGTVFTIGIPI